MANMWKEFLGDTDVPILLRMGITALIICLTFVLGLASITIITTAPLVALGLGVGAYVLYKLCRYMED